MISIGIPKGTRDFYGSQILKRKYIFDILTEIFTKYGYEPLETPALENLNVLLGKYGEEADKLIFRILNSGNFLSEVDNEMLEKKNYNAIANAICEKGLRYDLTVPLARYVAMNYNNITFPFKRYQIQPVWRADKPQRGRYREFYQCDIDIVGSDSLLNEVELIQIIDDFFNTINLKVKIIINHRNILYGLAKFFNLHNNFDRFTNIIDKVEKIGLDEVHKQLNVITSEADKIVQFLEEVEKIRCNYEKLNFIENKIQEEHIQLGVKDIRFILEKLDGIKIKTEINYSIKLSRGLSYYTGAIFEVKSLEYEIGSICGGGRYDNLTQIFGIKNISGVGVSFGADRIYDVLEATNKFPEKLYNLKKVLIIIMNDKFFSYANKLANELRKNNIIAFIHPDYDSKIKKLFSYANKKNFNYVIIIGEDEYNTQTITIKNLNTGNQINVENEKILNSIYEI